MFVYVSTWVQVQSGVDVGYGLVRFGKFLCDFFVSIDCGFILVHKFSVQQLKNIPFFFFCCQMCFLVIITPCYLEPSCSQPVNMLGGLMLRIQALHLELTLCLVAL